MEKENSTTKRNISESPQPELSILIPIYKEGSEFTIFLKEVVDQLATMPNTYEIIILDSPTEDNSIDAVKDFIKESGNPNIYITTVKWTPPAVTDKTTKYMVGYKLSRGNYILQMDGDGQDHPKHLPEFIEKLEEGYDMVTGYKQKRLDDSFYMFTSKIANSLNRILSGSKVHDMNCGYKGFQVHVAKGLNLRSGYFRFLPAILAIKKYKVTEVPVEHRQREFGEGKFNFISRFQGGVFDLLAVVIVTRMGDTPFYFFGWLSLACLLLSIVGFFKALFLWLLFKSLFLMVATLLFTNVLFIIAAFSLLIGLAISYMRVNKREEFNNYPVIEIFPERVVK